MDKLTHITQALSLAAKYHAQQKRKSDNSPYVNHLIECIDLLVRIGRVEDVDELCAAILHDSLEDTAITLSMIREQLGDHILSLVKALTDDKSLSLAKRREKTIKKLPKMTDSVKRIKLADICSNVSSIPANWSKKRVAEYFTWLNQVAALCRPASEPLYQEYLIRSSTSSTS